MHRSLAARVLGVGVVVATTGRGASAAPSEPDRIVAGQALAKANDYGGAIREFLAAEQSNPGTLVACLLGLAELRRGEAAQAEVWFATCRQRVTPTDPVPGWLPPLEQDLAQQLLAMVPITLRVDPDDAAAVFTIDGWDHEFRQRALHLTSGTYRVRVRTRAGLAERLIRVDAASSLRVVVTLQPRAPVVAGPSAPAPPEIPDVPPVHGPVWRSRLALGTGIGLLVLGGVLDVTGVRAARNHLAAAVSNEQYDARHGRYAAWRGATVGALAAGVATIAVGILLRGREHAPPTLAMALHPGGGVVSLGWAR